MKALLVATDLGQVRDRLVAAYRRVRARTEALAAPLSAEDQQLQSMPDASPTKWHRAHTTWFFEAFVLSHAKLDVVDPRYEYLFNSYYDSVGARQPRGKRGLLSRPSVVEIADYRNVVDERLERLLALADTDMLARVLPIVELGIAHEEQHHELLLTDILHAFSENPTRPMYRSDAPSPEAASAPHPARFVSFDGGLKEIGAPDVGFAFDNERPRHKRWVDPFSIADRLVTVRELKAFIDEGGYRSPSLWLSEGFDFVHSRGVTSPLHTTYEDGRLSVFTLAGTRVPHDDEPVVHASFYEADAIARFLGARLPTEAEWETVAEGRLTDARDVHQLFGDAWQWTRSSYEPYPGYEAPTGALGEYNGKFMISQMVLRGGSCFTPPGHVRASYRNFWHPHTQFQMTGIRLARGVPG